ncbi:MAG: bifunctional lysylphosphatidylglycerol flippase/synthetase MprF [Xanthomonadaceae bacterium]|jgi:phosphatidylglycerol lysyltransferase|nr:bifunctional lysylphosphatidylglycerol flippase/synthetase MprF [Xanthomonadaceae bacterium]
MKEPAGEDLTVSRVAHRLAKWRRWKPWLVTVATTLLVVLVVTAFHRLWQEISYQQLIEAIRRVPAGSLILALLATAVSYTALTGYDRSAIRYVGAKVRYRVVAETSFIAYALTNTIGLGVFTGGAVRMRLYSAAGMSVGQVSRAIAFNAVAFGLGITMIGSLGVWLDAAALSKLLHVSAGGLRVLAGLTVVAIAGLIVWCGRGREVRLLGRWSLSLPMTSLALQQLLWSAIDIIATAAVLWVLLPSGAISFPAFVGFFAAAIILGVISHIPGGIGVFETVMLVALGNQVPPEALVGALVLYRLIYYIIPLLLALFLLLLYELRRGVNTPIAKAAANLTPLLLAAYTLVIAIILLVSGVTPVMPEATTLLALHVPLPLVETSHFISSIIGFALLFVARGILLRLDAAWWAAIVLTALGLLLALPKGIAVSETALLASLVLVLALSHRQFTRKASLLAVRFTGGWLLAVAAILAALIALLFFVYHDVEYARQLWWQFEFDGDAPRSLRALVGVALLALALAIWQLLRPSPAVLEKPDAEAFERVAAIVRSQDNADAGLALTGDKQFLFSDSGNAFVMFGRQGRSWISLFDPVGVKEECQELVWMFLARAREGGGRACFYQVRPEALPWYLDAGLRLFKLGEYAYVPLERFSLQGRRYASLRHSVTRAEREGLAFEMIPVEGVVSILSEIRAISDRWLDMRRAAEKRFSVGAFVDAYVLRQPVAVVRKDEKIVAFATLLETDQNAEASIDLMRHLPDMPYGAMDFLFSKLLLYYKGREFQRFGLGMAPLSGMAKHPLAPLWQRFGNVLYARGENVYNFRGLRAFKEKFDPVWEARYLASPGGVAPLLILADIAALIGGGLKGVISK